MTPERRLERLRPAEIRAAMAERPRIFLPLGTIEWHSEHLPVGLDALTAHGLCLDAAERSGGLVFPPLYYGTGGGHGGYPWTVMMPEGSELRRLIEVTLARLDAFGVRQVVILSGHFAGEQVDLIQQIAAAHEGRSPGVRVRALAVDMNPEAPLAPDHAGLFETTLLHAYHPDLVSIEALPPPRPGEVGEDAFGPQRHDPRHSLHGVFGPDPRALDRDLSGSLRESMVRWLVEQAEAGHQA